MNKKRYIFIISLILAIVVLSKPTFAQDQEDNEENLQENVEQRLQQVSNRLKAYIGTVTNKTEDTLQLENDENAIKLNSVNENTTYARANGSSETIDFDDIGIGDYVITMGKTDENDVLMAQRVVVSSVPEELTSNAEMANITSVEDDIVVEILPNNNELVLELNTGYDLTQRDDEGEITDIRLSTLQAGDKIIIVGINDGDVYETDRIHVVEKVVEEE